MDPIGIEQKTHVFSVWILNDFYIISTKPTIRSLMCFLFNDPLTCRAQCFGCSEQIGTWRKHVFRKRIVPRFVVAPNYPLR